jgi:hypothetical protein
LAVPTLSALLRIGHLVSALPSSQMNKDTKRANPAFP